MHMNVTLDGCCDHTQVISDEELHQYSEDMMDRADGGPGLGSTLAQLGLVDEYHFLIQPIVAGRGPQLLGGILEFETKVGASEMKTIKCMMEHLYWADERILDGLEESGTKNKDLLKLVRHIAVAERVWLSRLLGESSTQYSLWEEAEDLTAIRTIFKENAEQFRIYIEGLKESELDEMIDYANQSGVPFRTSIRDILSQVILHGQYHRGQINRELRTESAEPVQVDYITFARL